MKIAGKPKHWERCTPSFRLIANLAKIYSSITTAAAATATKNSNQ